MTPTADGFAHNVQRGRIERNRLLHPLWLSTLDPADDYLTVYDCPARKFDGRTFERTNAAYLAEGDDLHTLMPMTFEGGVTITVEADDVSHVYSVSVNGTCLGTYDYYLHASRAARAIVTYARGRRVETSRLS